MCSWSVSQYHYIKTEVIRFSVQTQEHTTALRWARGVISPPPCSERIKSFFGISRAADGEHLFPRVCVCCARRAGPTGRWVKTQSLASGDLREVPCEDPPGQGVYQPSDISVLPVPMKHLPIARRDERAAPEKYLNEKHSITYSDATPVQHESPLTRTHKFSQYPRTGPLCAI